MFVSYRLYLRYLGYEQYGLWLILSTAINIVQLGSIGLSPALTRLVAQNHRIGGDDAVQRYLSMSVSLVTSAGLVLTVLVIRYGGSSESIFKFSPHSSTLFLALLPYVTLLSVYAMVVDLFLATLAGLGRIDLANYAQLISQCAAVLLTVVLLRSGFGIYSLLGGSAFYYVLLHGLYLFHIAQLMPLRFSGVLGWNWSELRGLLSFGGWAAATTMISSLIGPLMRIFLARYSGVGSVPLYDAALTASWKLRSVWDAPMRALLPEMSRHSTGSGTHDLEEISRIYSNAYRILLIGATPMYAAAFVLTPVILKIWLGLGPSDSSVATLRILLAASYVNLHAIPAYHLLMATGKVRHCFVSSLLLGVVTFAGTFTVAHCSGTLSTPAASAAFLFGSSVLSFYLLWSANKVRKGGEVFLYSTCLAIHALILG